MEKIYPDMKLSYALVFVFLIHYPLVIRSVMPFEYSIGEEFRM